MTLNFTGKVRLVLEHVFKNELDLSVVTDAINKSWTQSIANGTGADKAQIVWHDQRTVNAGANDDLDLAGVLVSAFGAVTFTKLKGMAILIETETTNYRLLLGGGSDGNGTNAVPIWGDVAHKEPVQAKGLMLKTWPIDGVAVTGGSADILRVNNPSAGAVTYNIIIWGEGTIP